MLIQRVEKRLMKTSKDNLLISLVSFSLEHKFIQLLQIIGKIWELVHLELNQLEKVERIRPLQISILIRTPKVREKGFT
tara:strand:- start:460 stop:696 length:237 start_codon:yes stop_codon:yes gene_type:complete